MFDSRRLPPVFCTLAVPEPLFSTGSTPATTAEPWFCASTTPTSSATRTPRVNSIFEGLRWLDLGWDEEYKQSERLALHRQIADAIFQKGLAYRDFTPAHTGDSEKSGANQTWLFNPGHARTFPRRKRPARRCRRDFRPALPGAARNGEQVRFNDAVYGEQIKAADDIEDFALLRSDGMPTYHLASCADDIDLRISHIIRGQDHLSNTYKHVLIFEGAGGKPPQFAHLPLLVAPDGSKLSKRRHGPVVSVTTYRDAGFLPEAFINFLCLLGWSPKDDRDQMTRQELIDAFSLEGINRANAVVNFKEPAATPDETFDPKALWLNAEHIRALSVDELSARLLPVVREAGFQITPEKMLAITPLIRERIKLLRDVLTAADFFFVDELPPYDPAELDSAKGRCGHGAQSVDSGPRSSGANRIQARPAGSEPARRRPGNGPEGRTDVSADSSGRLRSEERPAAV